MQKDEKKLFHSIKGSKELQLITEVWSDDNSIFDREETEQYVKSQDPDRDVLPNPEVAYLDEVVFPLLTQALVKMLLEVKQTNSFNVSNSLLNGLDCISEYLYNKNPNHPERASEWTYIFDMEWVEQCLREKPRPFYPFHLIWTEHFAALKIQSYMRGYWVRCREDIQELRHFWKSLKEERKRLRFSTAVETSQDME